jgi:regulatory protein
VVITGLRADTRVSGCVILEADGARIASLPAEILRELSLQVGTELSESQQERILQASAAEAARRVAVRLLATRPRAIQDLRRRLRDRGHGQAAIDQAIERLTALGLLNDDEFARHYVRIRSTRGIGPSRLVHDLLAVGVDRRVAERAIEEVSAAEGIDPAGAARQLAEKRVGQLSGLPVAKRRRRLLLYLARRGFQGREVREMVTKLTA